MGRENRTVWLWSFARRRALEAGKTPEEADKCADEAMRLYRQGGLTLPEIIRRACKTDDVPLIYQEWPFL